MNKNTTFPDPLAKWGDKIDDTYGLAFAKSISQDWFNGGLIDGKCEYSSRSSKIRENRLYTRGEQDTEKHKKLFVRQDGDLSLANLDWRILNSVQKFCRVVSNGIRDDHYRIDIRTNDRMSLNIKAKEREKHLKNMRAMPLLKSASKSLGVNLMPQGFVPKDSEELNLFEQLKEKTKIEIAEEIIIDYVKETNRWSNIEKKKNQNLVENAICGVRVYTDNREGLKIDSFDIEELVHSNVKENDFSDAFYFGVVDSITINDLQRESNLDVVHLKKISKTYLSKNKDKSSKDISGHKVDVLRFAFKTTKEENYKAIIKKGKTIHVSKKDDDFEPPKRSDYKKVTSYKDTWVEGSYIIGTEFIYDYKESEHIVRDELNKPQSPFVVFSSDIYENRLHSFLDDIKPLADELQNIHIKIQHLRSELKPDLIHIDLDQLAELEVEGNKEKNWQHSLSILNVKGVVFSQRTDMGEDGMKDGAAVSPMSQQQGSGLVPLLNLYAHYYNQIRDITGVNPARDGSMPHDALLGVNQLNLSSSNTTTQHIVDAALGFNKKVAEVISSRIHAIFRNPEAKHLRKLYERAVGKQNLDALESLKDRHLHDFGFTVEILPSQEEMTEFKEDLGLYLQQGLISPEIKSEAVRIAKTNVKLAVQYLAYMSKKRLEQMNEEKRATMEMKTQSDIAAANQASSGRIKEEAIKAKMKINLETSMSKIRVFEKQAMQEIEAPEKDKKFRQEVYLEQLKNITQTDMAKFKEDSKDKRLNVQSSHQSKLIDQRKKESEPHDFSLDINL
ncbi:hypothetical protein SAMN04489761_4292 [Tenacibaculum sp. MAR_2009_124]|uniref:hypothetical protein n=1 Tax=Tenacibaculum sp. MAR_2009_124 TaxID=1250059 RepID=UPI00089B4759|nr:hypothetical protein [Tenacibaculum sp. MAR_2009_124]SED10585.1 hypothetical protein SAMN04489761_4292 [Tenacibaculum sp. MAR_2009_124]